MSIAQKVLADPGKYSIQQLQQGVQSGVIPAYIAVPLIQEKVQQQKQFQMAQAMQQPPAQQRPPVAQQIMAEARGLEGLSTNLPTEYADGGIVAFDEGGQVPRFNGMSGSVPSTSSLYDVDPKLARDAVRRAELIRAVRLGLLPAAALETGLGLTTASTGIMGGASPEQRRGFYSNPMMGAMSPDSALAGAIMNAGEGPDQTGGGSNYLQQMGNVVSYLGKTLTSAPGDEMSPKGYGITRLLSGLSDTKPTAATTAQPTDLGPVPGTSGSTGILGGTPTGPAAQPATGGGLRAPGTGTGIAGGMGGAPKLKLPEGPSYESMAKDYYSGYGKEAEARDKATEEKIAAARAKVTGKPFEKLEESLKKEETEAKTEKDQAGYMAVFKAGLRMLSGTSPFALANIGAGGEAGLESYKDAMKDMRKAEKERQKQFAYIEQARRAESIGDRDTEIASIEKARDRADARARYIGEGVYKATGMDKERADKVALAQFGADSDIFKTHVAGGYQLGAAALRQREGITPYQMARLRQEAEKQVDPNVIRAQVAQQLKLSKAPKPGADKDFEKRVQEAYNAAIEDRIGRNLGYGFAGVGGGGSGLQLPQGYKVLGVER